MGYSDGSDDIFEDEEDDEIEEIEEHTAEEEEEEEEEEDEEEEEEEEEEETEEDTEEETDEIWTEGNEDEAASVAATHDSVYGNDLHKAVIAGDVQLVNHLLAARAKPNARDAYGNTPLHYAVADAKSTAIIKALIDNGADVSLKNDANERPLHLAANKPALMAIADLLVAVKDDDVDAVMILTSAGIDVNEVRGGVSGRTALHFAILDENVKMTKLLVNDCNASLHVLDSSGWTPLHTAASVGSVEITNILTEHGADVQAKSSSGSTPLHIAAAAKLPPDLAATRTMTGAPLEIDIEAYRRVTETLIEKGASPLVKDEEGLLPLHWAAKEGMTETCEVLLKTKPSTIYATNDRGWSALHYAASRKHAHTCQFLIDEDSEKARLKTMKTSSGKTAFDVAGDSQTRFSLNTIWEAISTGNLALAREILINRDDVQLNKKSRSGDTPLQLAARKGRGMIARLFLENGADPNTQDKDGNTVLHTVLSQAKPDTALASVCLAHGADPSIPNSAGTPAAHMIALKGTVALFLQMLKTGPRAVRTDNLVDKKGNTLFHIAAQTKEDARASACIKYQLSPFATNLAGEMPLHVACRKGSLSVVKYIVNLQPKGDNSMLWQGTRNKSTPLHVAARRGHIDIVSFLVKRRAPLGAVDKNNNPAWCVSEDGNVREWLRIQLEAEEERQYLARKDGKHPMDDHKYRQQWGTNNQHPMHSYDNQRKDHPMHGYDNQRKEHPMHGYDNQRKEHPMHGYDNQRKNHPMHSYDNQRKEHPMRSSSRGGQFNKSNGSQQRSQTGSKGWDFGALPQ